MEAQEVINKTENIYLYIGILTFMLGLFLICVLPNKKISREYKKGKDGSIKRVKKSKPDPNKIGKGDEAVQIDFTGGFKSKGSKNAQMKSKVSNMSNQMYNMFSKKDPILLVLFYGAAVARLMINQFTTYYLLWITTFVSTDDKDTAEGKLGKEESLDLYQNVTNAGMVLALFALPIAGYCGDRIPFEVQMVFAFGLRMVAIGGFFFLTNPENMLAYVISVMVFVGTSIENVVVNALFAKKLKGDIRGAMTGLLTSVSQMGSLVFSQASVIMIKEYGI